MIREIIILDYIDTYEEKVHVYIHTKDNRFILVEDIVTNPVFDGQALHIDYMEWDSRYTFVMLQDDFSYLKFRTFPREHEEVTKKDYDKLYNYIEDDIEYFESRMDSEILREP